MLYVIVPKILSLSLSFAFTLPTLPVEFSFIAKVVSLTAETFDRSMNCKQLAEKLHDITARFQID